MKQINWRIIGLSAIASQFVKAFEFVNNAKLLSIASKTPNNLKKFQEDF